MSYGQCNKAIDALQMKGSEQPTHGRSPIVRDDVHTLGPQLVEQPHDFV
jgi:hypothetical protein